MSGNTKDSLRRGADLQEKVNSIIEKVHFKYNLVLEGVCGSHLSDVIFFLHAFKNSLLRFTCGI